MVRIPPSPVFCSVHRIVAPQLSEQVAEPKILGERNHFAPVATMASMGNVSPSTSQNSWRSRATS